MALTQNETQIQTQETLKCGYDALLLGHAAGTLDVAQDLAVQTHLGFSQTARDFIQSCECIGGALMQDTPCCDQDMSAGSLESVLDRLDEEDLAKPTTDITAGLAHDAIGFDLPAPLAEFLCHQKKANWKPLFHGLQSYDLKVNCNTSTARFLKADPGVKSPHHSHGGTEITLVLDGAFSDETGSYKRGDLIVTDETCHHAPVACKMQGCVCLVVSTAPIKLTGIARLLNPFLKR